MRRLPNPRRVQTRRAGLPLPVLVVAAIGVLAGTEPAVAEGYDRPLTVGDCVRIALARNARVDEAEAKVAHTKAKLAEMQSVYYPKLRSLMWVAPMFTIEGDGTIPGDQVTKRYSELSDWGPYTHLQATLAQPLYTFGRVKAGKRAAEERVLVEEARVRQTENTLAREVRRLYYTQLFAESLEPTLRWAAGKLEDAQEKAQSWYDEGTGKITKVELSKLDYADSRLKMRTLQAEQARDVSRMALKFAMGLPARAEIELADRRLPRDVSPPERELPDLLLAASVQRPEWAQLSHGKEAALALASARRLANAPELFLAGRFSANWTPTVDEQDNPFHEDTYNGVGGGLSLALRFDLDPAKSRAKVAQAEAKAAQVEAMKEFARSGIPLEVRKAYDQAETKHRMVEHARAGRRATRSWVQFASSSFMTGTGDAKDLVDGLANYLESTYSYYKNVHEYFVAQAELTYAIGVGARGDTPATTPNPAGYPGPVS